MAHAKRFILGTIVTGYTLLLLIIAVNYIIDPFEAAGSGFIKPVQHLLNQRIVKTRTLEARHASFNGYIMGSSRSHEIEPQMVERYIPGSHFFTLSFNSASVADQLRILNHMLSNHYPIKHLLIQLDIPNDAYEKQLSYRDPKASMQMFPPRVHSLELHYQLSFLKVFYLQLRWDALSEKFIKRHLIGPEIYFDKTGVANWVKYKREMAEDPEAYLQAHFQPTKHVDRHRGNMADLEGNIAGIKHYVDFCRSQHINCIFFTPPINKHNLNEWHVEYYLAYLKALANQTNFWSFSDYNSITTNDYLYVDSIHYHPKIIPIILGRIFNDGQVAVPKDFGRLVTNNNVVDYLAMLRLQFTAADQAVAP